MLAKIISMPFNPATGGFDDTELREFIKDKYVTEMREHLFTSGGTPCLALVVMYFPLATAAAAGRAEPEEKREEPWREALSGSGEMDLFNALRDWRSLRARKEDVPPYIIFTNKQLAGIVKRKPRTAEEFATIEGVGKSRLEKYATEVLAILEGNEAPPDS